MTHLSKVTCNYLRRAFSQNPLAKWKLDVFLTENGNFLLPLLCHVASGTMVVRQKASNEMALVPTHVQLQAFGRPKRVESMVECVSGGPLLFGPRKTASGARCGTRTFPQWRDEDFLGGCSHGMQCEEEEALKKLEAVTGNEDPAMKYHTMKCENMSSFF